MTQVEVVDGGVFLENLKTYQVKKIYGGAYSTRMFIVTFPLLSISAL